MPDLFGLSCEQAQREVARLLGQPLACNRGTPTNRVAAGTVQRQEPAARSPVVPGRGLQARVWIEPAAAPTVIVPALLGETADSAVQRLRGAGLVPRLDPPRPGPWHRVRAQQPAAGSRVPPETVVAVQLAPALTVPDLAGRDCTQAQDVARAAGFPDVQCVDEDAPADAAAGRVRRQQPPAGALLDAPRPLQAWTARPRTRVPDLRGQPEAQALQAARQARLVPQARGPAAAAGRIVAEQVPAAGSLAAPDSPLDLRLALTVPALAGRRCDAAQPLVRAHGFAELRCTERPARAGEPLRLIVEQQPAAGSALAAPEPLRAVVALPTVVPAVEGRPLAEAEARVTAAGLQARPDARDGEREVQQQQPAAGSEVAPGAVVLLRTRRLVAVPDLVGQTPADAASAAAQAGLGARADADDGARRRVRGQQPAPGTRVPAGTVVELATVQRVAVPDLRDTSCAQAGQAAAAAGVDLTRCEVDSRVPLVLGTPRIVRQAPPAGTEVDARSPVVATALPPWWSLPTLIGGVLAAALGLAWKIVPPKPPRLPMGWRVVPDAAPRVTVRMAAPPPAEPADAPAGRGPAWRIERPPPRVWLRGLEDDEP
jgi:beta-lactam-binding protein with PASTA domain